MNLFLVLSITTVVKRENTLLVANLCIYQLIERIKNVQTNNFSKFKAIF